MSRRVGLFLVSGFLVTLLAGVGIDVWAGHRAAAEYARLEKRFGSLDGRSMVAPRVPIEDNSARFVRAAAALAVRDDVDKGFGVLLASFKRFENTPASAPLPEDVRAFVEANQAAMRLAAEARSRHAAGWDADHGESGGANVPSWLSIRTVSNALYFGALLDMKAGQADAAAEHIAAGFAVSASLRNEPSLISQLIRVATATQHCDAVARLIAQAEPSKSSLEALAVALAQSRGPDPMYVGLLAELRLGNTRLLLMEEGHRTVLSDYSKSMWVGPLARVGRPFLRLARIRYLQDMERLLDAEAGPRPRLAGSKTEPRLWDVGGRLSDAYTRGLGRAMDSGDEFASALGVSQIGVALRRYRLDRGNYPDSLAALVPAYLAQLPIDTVTGRAPSYARNGAGFTLQAQPIGGRAPSNSALDWTVPK